MQNITKQIYRLKNLENIGRITKSNKSKAINSINNIGKSNAELEKAKKSMTIRELTVLKKEALEMQTKTIVEIAINQGLYLVAERYAGDLKKSNDVETSRLGEYAVRLAKAQYKNIKNTKKEDLKTLNNTVMEIDGVSTKSVTNEFEKTVNESDVDDLIEKLEENTLNEKYYENTDDFIDRVFKRVNIVRADDIEMLKQYMREKGITKSVEIMDKLFESLEYYGSKQGRYGKDDTTLLNSRLDNLLINAGIKKGGQRKVNKIFNEKGINYHDKTNVYKAESIKKE